MGTDGGQETADRTRYRPAGAEDGKPRVDPIEYLRIVRRRWPWILVLTCVGLAVGYLTAKPPPEGHASSAQTPSYYTATTVLELPAGTDPSGLNLDGIAYFANNPQVAKMVAQQIGYRGNPLNLQVAATPKDNLGLLFIQVNAPDPARATLVADVWANQLINFLDGQIQASQQRQLTALSARVNQLKAAIDKASGGSGPLAQATLNALQSQYGTVNSQYQTLSTSQAPSTLLSVFQPALVAPAAAPAAGSGSSSPAIPVSRPKRTALGGGAGLVAGLALALVVEWLDPRLRTRRQVEDVSGLPVLAEIPPLSSGRRARLEVRDMPGSPAAEAFRVLRTALLAEAGAAALDNGSRTAVLVTSPGTGDGKSVVVANLAASLAETGASVMILGADPVRGNLPSVLDTPSSPGLTDLLAGTGNGVAAVAQQTSVSGVQLVPPGATTDAPGRLVTRPRVAGVVLQARQLARFVVIDCPPVLGAHDAAEMAGTVNEVLLVCRLGHTTRDDLPRAQEQLARAGAPVRGIVLVNGSTR